MAPKILRPIHALACLVLLSGVARVINAECTEAYQKIKDHTLCLEDSPNLLESPVVSSAEEAEIVDGHNEKRRKVDPAATNMQQVKWDPKIAEVAQKWAKQCILSHDKGDQRSITDYPGVYIGQNGASGGGKFSWTQMIDMWYSEVKDFTYGVGATPQTAVVGHFTQVVLHKVARLGCGYAQCSNGHFYMCNYAFGQYGSDMAAPYEKGDSGSACANNNDGLCDCDGKLCMNGGSLDVGSCTCSCPKLYKGDTCEDDCDGKRCMNRGSLDIESCTCSCPKPYKGDTCEEPDCPSEEPSYCPTWATKENRYCKRLRNVPGLCPFTCGVCKKDESDKFVCPSEEPSYCPTWATEDERCKKFANVPGLCPFTCGLCKKDESDKSDSETG